MKLHVFRHAAYDTPWWAFPSSRPGRFHRGRQDTVQYLCLHPLGPAAEMLRHQIGPDGDPDHLMLNLWAAVVDVPGVVAIDFANCTDHGITPDELVGEDYAPTQHLADTVRQSGAPAMIVPSAALPGTHNLIVFGPRLAHPYLRPAHTTEEVPTGHLTDGARAATEVVPHIRWPGESHSAVEQFKTTGHYQRFADPLPTRW
ncbi:RES family NAD+ phosphorylase [Mycolicibacter icosiumassiliensis]|uniref:RES family NAD+ phosphorylase n=1 Tax=Mycolicibacter icosiumassiliensis TaxID=1792835 RepID=UPI0008313B07|nr:RES family NAD+ phosphorylase [Mycolicibacter icosiumassiliensis]